jgi:hypothetical protein
MCASGHVNFVPAFFVLVALGSDLQAKNVDVTLCNL